MPKVARGIQQTVWGYRAFVRVKGFSLQTKSFKRHVPLEDIKTWRELTRAKLIIKRERAEKAKKPSGTFRGDALRYLGSVTALITYKQRVQHIHEWIALFGDRETDTIASAEIRAQRDRWLTVGPKTFQRKGKQFQKAVPLSASSVNHRLRALENMWTVLWPGTPNVVRQVPEVQEPEAIPRALDYRVIEAIFAKLPAGKTKARLAVLRWTGIPASTLMRLSPEHVDLTRRLLWLPARKKGQGTRLKTLPLLPDAVKAFQQLAKANAWGAFSTSAMHKLFVAASRAAKIRIAVSPYQLRHTFGTNFLRATNDLRATQRALDHSTSRLTERYALSAVDPALASAFHRMAKATRKLQ